VLIPSLSVLAGPVRIDGADELPNFLKPENPLEGPPFDERLRSLMGTNSL
jgi:hypothetical protein